MIDRDLFRRTIGRKLMLIGLLATGVAVVAVSVALIIGGALEWRARVVSDLETYAAMIGANAAPAVMFDDAAAAAETLTALAAKPSIRYTAIFDREGRRFAEYRAPGFERAMPEAAPMLDEHRFTLSSVALSRRIVFKGDMLGVIVVQSDLSEVYATLARNTVLIVVAALIAFSAGTLLFLRLQRSIVGPIQGLAGAMQGIAQTQNYAVRVPVVSADEVGVLSEAFNGMLGQIQARDDELARHRDRLESEVVGRTAELREANAQLEKELAERRRAEIALQRYSLQIDTLSQMAATLQTCLAVEEASAVVGPALERLLPECSGAMYLLRSSKNLLENSVTWGSAPPVQTAFGPNDCWALRRGQLHIAAPALAAPYCQHAEGRSDCHVCAPMIAQGEVLGTLHLQTTGGVPPVGDQILLSRVAGEVAQALANLHYREALKNMAIRDPLTGLFNRRYLEEYLAMEISRSRRKGAKLSLAVIDIDHFKKYNDSFGHEAGDAVLRELGQFLARSVRNGDAACRYGGEEFIVAMWDTPLDEARQRAERLREEVKGLPVQLGGRALAPISLSVGVAAFPEHAEDAESLVRAADRALYSAKYSGRDRVCVAATL